MADPRPAIIWWLGLLAGLGGSPRFGGVDEAASTHASDGALRSEVPRSSLPGVGVLSAAWACQSNALPRQPSPTTPALSSLSSTSHPLHVSADGLGPQTGG